MWAGYVFILHRRKGRGHEFHGHGQGEDYNIIVMLFLTREPVFNLFSQASTPPPGNF